MYKFIVGVLLAVSLNFLLGCGNKSADQAKDYDRVLAELAKLKKQIKIEENESVSQVLQKMAELEKQITQKNPGDNSAKVLAELNKLKKTVNGLSPQTDNSVMYDCKCTYFRAVDPSNPFSDGSRHVTRISKRGKNKIETLKLIESSCSNKSDRFSSHSHITDCKEVN